MKSLIIILLFVILGIAIPAAEEKAPDVCVTTAPNIEAITEVDHCACIFEFPDDQIVRVFEIECPELREYASKLKWKVINVKEYKPFSPKIKTIEL